MSGGALKWTLSLHSSAKLRLQPCLVWKENRKGGEVSGIGWGVSKEE
jgi:hypothetical protein